MNGVQDLLIVVTAYVDQTGRTLMHQLREQIGPENSQPHDVCSC